MTTNDLQRLESALGRSLSPAVREFFLNFPPELHTIAAESDPDEGDFQLTEDVDTLIELNSERSWYRPIDWSPKIFILGAGACGETYWVDLDSADGTVWRFDAGQEAQYSDERDSIAEFARGIIGSDN